MKKKNIILYLVCIISLLICMTTYGMVGGQYYSGISEHEISDESFTYENYETTVVLDSDSFLEIHFIDVGQGDAVLVTCDGESMLIDGGLPEESRAVYSYLQSHGISHLNYIICTHPEADHSGGLSGALNYATVDKAYCSVDSFDGDAFKAFEKYLSEQGGEIEVPRQGTELRIGSAVGKIIGPVNISGDSNNDSLVIRIKYADKSFLFVGDAEEEAEQELINSGEEIRSSLLKIGHHGSSDSTGEAFLQKVSPEYAVISCGAYNEYGHPADETLNRLKAAGVKLLRTDMQGGLVFTCSSRGELSAASEKNSDADTYLTYYDLYVQAETITETYHDPEVSVSKQGTKAAEQSEAEYGYILNTNTMKFHNPACSSVSKMKESNKQSYTGTRDDLINMGYSPCGKCHP